MKMPINSIYERCFVYSRTQAEELINVSNGIITFNLIKAYETGEETLINN